jgi:hypothetical protein
MSRRKKEKNNKDHAPAPAAPRVEKQVVTRDLVEREFDDPQRLTLHLRRLSELLTIVADLRAARFPQDAIADALFKLDRAKLDAAPAEEKPRLLRQALVPALANEALAKTAKAALQTVLGQAREPQDRLALIAGIMLLDAWLRTKAPADQNPIWDAIFGLSVLDILFEGVVLARLARETVAAAADEGLAAKSIAKALAKAEVGAELDKLGLEQREPAELAKRYAELSRDRSRSYLLGFDSVLRLVRVNGEFATQNVQKILAEGLSPEVRKAALTAFDGAYQDDVTKPLVDDLIGEIGRRLGQLDKEIRGEAPAAPRPPEAEPLEQEKKNSLVALVALRSIPLEKNAFLRATYVGSFEVYRRAAPTEELPFVQRIWQDPNDRWALEEFEKFLLQRRHTHRANRVRRYLEEVRSAARAGGQAQPPSGGVPAPG